MEQFKRQWIKEHKEDTRDDHIIFRGDDPVILTQQKSHLLSSQEYSKPKKGMPGPGNYGREHMNDKDWEAKFDLLMREDLIDLPPHLREEKLYFTDPNQMDEIFKELEERNLYLINRKQEIEHTLET
jgi:hypothetical protein